MAKIVLDSAIPDNIIALGLDDPKRVRAHFERGDVVVLKDVRIKADFAYLSSIKPPVGTGVRKDKYVLSKAVNGIAETRACKWAYFQEGSFDGDAVAFAKFREHVEGINTQLDSIVRSIFGRTRFLTEFTTWKFQRIEGENLHIDNLSGCDKVAQFRIFANLDTQPRKWAVGRHWRHYAERHYHRAGFQAVADDAFQFNGLLSQTAFGPSWSDCDEPRHFVEFEPGEIWLTNSSLVAHQVRAGNLLVSGHYEYPFSKCRDRSNSLPAQLAALGGNPYQPTLAERLGRFARYFSAADGAL